MSNLDRIDVPVPSSDSLVDLLPPSTKRWVVKRKAMVVAAVQDGVLSLQEACRQYNLSVEEFLAWERSLRRYGVTSLKVTHLQTYRAIDAVLAKHQSENPRR